jgi:hypothetical protein
VTAAGADASCIYLESLSFSLLCTIEYTHTVLPNFHIVTLIVTDVHDVTALIHCTAAGADASCIYLESFFFSLLSTIEYTHTILPNFHIVTATNI